MSTIATTVPLKATEDHRSARMPFIPQVFMIARRVLVTQARVPAAILPGVIISVFFLVIYDSSLGGASGFIPGLVGQSYLGFILPLSVVSSALSGASIAGDSIVTDIENGYFDKLLLTPVSRAALLLGPMIAGGILLAFQTLFVIAVGLIMGLDPKTGPLGLVALVGIALLLGMGFSGLTVGVALRTGSSAATTGASFLFFPLSFLAPTFVPINLLEGWIRTAAEWNPITYIVTAGRVLMNTGWETEPILRGIGSALLLGVILFLFALSGLRARTRRK